jgi:acyl dehydratase
MAKRYVYLEDFVVGEVIELGSRPVSREEIVEFATRYDPQPFHVDENAAKASIFGGLIASGWHTASMFMRLFVDRVLAGGATLGSPGIDEIRWPRPVRPGDTLAARVTVLEAVPSRSKPDRGHVRIRYEVSNQMSETVMTMVGVSLYRRHPAVEQPSEPT